MTFVHFTINNNCNRVRLRSLVSSVSTFKARSAVYWFLYFFSKNVELCCGYTMC